VNEKFCYWFKIREPVHIFPSAFFQNLEAKDAPFYVGDKETILRTFNLESLLEYFLSWDWEVMEMTNIDLYFDIFER